MFKNKELIDLNNRIVEIRKLLIDITTEIAVIRQNQLTNAATVLNTAKQKKHDMQDLIDNFIETKMVKMLENGEVVEDGVRPNIITNK